MTNEIFGGQAEPGKDNAPKLIEPALDPMVQKRLEDKDNHIKQLESENAQMREHVGKLHEASKQLDPLKQEIQSLKAELSKLQPGAQAPALSAVDIKSLVQRTISEAETERSAADNIKEATDKFAAHFGGDYERASKAVAEKAAALGLTPDWLKGVAAKSPSAFLRLMTDQEAPATSAENGSKPFVQGKVNTEALGQQHQTILKVGTKAYYDDMMKKEPKRYFSPKVQLELMENAKKGVYWS